MHNLRQGGQSVKRLIFIFRTPQPFLMRRLHCMELLNAKITALWGILVELDLVPHYRLNGFSTRGLKKTSYTRYHEYRWMRGTPCVLRQKQVYVPHKFVFFLTIAHHSLINIHFIVYFLQRIQFFQQREHGGNSPTFLLA